MKKIFLLLLTILFLCWTIRPTKQDVYSELVKVNTVNPTIALKIAILESSLKNNNLFGFRANIKYFKFKTWQESVKYFKKWEDTRYYIHLSKYHSKDSCNYYHFLQSQGYVDGKPFSKANVIYVNNLKKIKI